jgi:hypothetical protein
VSQRLAPELRDRGGLLKVGIYSSRLEVIDVASKIAAVDSAFQRHQWLRDLFAFRAATYAGLSVLREHATANFVLPPADTLKPAPKLHLKSNLFASQEAWQFLADPAWVNMTGEFAEQRVLQLRMRDSTLRYFIPSVHQFVTIADGPIQNWFDSLKPEVREKVVFYTVMGSQNQNARSMVMDGEVALVTSAWPSVIPYIDLISLIGQSVWLDDPAQLQLLLPPQSKFRTRMAHWFRYFF